MTDQRIDALRQAQTAMNGLNRQMIGSVGFSKHLPAVRAFRVDAIQNGYLLTTYNSPQITGDAGTTMYVADLAGIGSAVVAFMAAAELDKA